MESPLEEPEVVVEERHLLDGRPWWLNQPMIPAPSDIPILVLATTEEAGRKYANQLGLRNAAVFDILTDPMILEGLRVRGLAIEPTFISRIAEGMDFNAKRLFNVATRLHYLAA